MMEDVKRRFVDALESEDLDAIRRVAKSDHHIHSTLSASIGSASRALGVEIPAAPASYEGFGPFNTYYDRHVRPHLQTAAAIESIVRAGIEDAVTDGVTVIEMMIRDYADRIDLRPEIGIARPFDPTSSFVERNCSAYIDSGLFRSIDVYGIERTDLLVHLIRLYDRAAFRGLKRKAHAGEFGTANSVIEAVRLLELEEVQHGIAAAESRTVMRELVSRGTRLNICPTSNVRLGAAGSYRMHPIRALFDAGVPVTIGSDDPLVFGRTVSEEYLTLSREAVFSPQELDSIREAGLD